MPKLNSNHSTKPPSSEKIGYPYSDIIDGLVCSTMRAQRYVIAHCKSGQPLAKIDHQQINRHFCWLSVLNKEGQNRHLVEAPAGMAPLATRSLRSKSSIPPELRNAFEEQQSVGWPHDALGEKQIPPAQKKYVQEDATRISALIIDSFKEFVELGTRADGATEPVTCFIKSPLSIIYDYLTVPDTPGTRAYALVACRNYLFRAFELVPDLDGKGNPSSFSVLAIEESLSHIWTSFRERYLSRGDDKLPPGSRGNVDGLIRHHLAMRKILFLRFQSEEECISYLSATQLAPLSPQSNSEAIDKHGKKKRSYKFEFTRPNRLNNLPEAGEIVNELWGLPIPLRGADIVFKGGLKFSGRQGLVMAIHGGPGAGKTSFALAFAAYLAPFGITSWFLTAEEIKKDLVDRVNGLMPDQVARLSFFPSDFRDYILFRKFDLPSGKGFRTLDEIEEGLMALAQELANDAEADTTNASFYIPRPCDSIVVLDGLHDLFAVEFSSARSDDSEKTSRLIRLYQLVEKLRSLHALVILTTGTAWAGDSTLDYLVDVAIRLSHESTDEYGQKPDRRFTLTKARHQLCAGGTHGLQIGGMKGVRLSPQINYQLEKQSHWRPRLPDTTQVLPGLCRARSLKSIGELMQLITTPDTANAGKNASYVDSPSSVSIYEGSHVFINGQGSGGKAALAMKLAISPSFKAASIESSLKTPPTRQRVLVVSFLYPADYYEHLLRRLRVIQQNEYRREKLAVSGPPPRLEVIHLYPGHLRPHDLFNRIEWELDAAELNADPYTCVVIDGIHNVFLQFPEIEKYGLFWPQLYSALRSRKVTTISTHTTLALPYQTWQQTSTKVDDNRSEPLRHALVQKTDFQFEVDPWPLSQFALNYETLPSEYAVLSDLFVVKTVSAIGQRLPRGHILWSREELELYDLPKHYFDQPSNETDGQLTLR
ncbi:hypothetical protein [Polaromonas sp. YR568]|uniref:hypothetical protein n=1 Tax=Polaromonas sp. YR568 TaxID=1855301 RepID=UPI00398BDD64